MPDYNFRVVVGQSAPAGAEVNPLTNIRPRVQPAGRVKTRLLDRLTGTYTALQISRLARTWFALDDAGILDRLDGLFIRGRNVADGLLNWVPGKPNASNSGGSFAVGQGFILDGVDDSLNMNVAYERFTLDSASFFANALVMDPTSNRPLIGRTSGGVYARLYPYQFGAGVQSANGTINALATVSGAYSGPNAGLWAMSRSGLSQTITRNGAVIATGEEPTIGLPAGLLVGSNPPSFGAFTVSAFGYGGHLTPAELAALQGILAAHHQFV